MLKTLIAYCDASSTESELPDLLEQLRSPISMKTMGGLVTEFFERLYSEVPDPKRDAGTEGGWIAFGIRFGDSTEASKTEMEMFTLVLNERNQLIHHVLPYSDLRSDDSRRQLESLLDDQFVRIESVYKFLQRRIESVNEMFSMFRDLIPQVLEKHRAHPQDTEQ